MLFISEKGWAIVEFSFVAYFCLAVIGSPKFKIEVSKDERKTTLYVEDIPTAVLDAQKQTRTIQDIFKNDLHYRITYNKAKSSGKVRDDYYTLDTCKYSNLCV